MTVVFTSALSFIPNYAVLFGSNFGFRIINVCAKVIGFDRYQFFIERCVFRQFIELYLLRRHMDSLSLSEPRARLA